MSNLTDAILVDAVITFGLVYLVPASSIGLARALGLLVVPDDAPVPIRIWASETDPEQALGKVGRALNRYLSPERSKKVVRMAAALINALVLASFNILLVLLNTWPNQNYAPDASLRVLSALSIVVEAIWFWWFRRFAARHG